MGEYNIVRCSSLEKQLDMLMRWVVKNRYKQVAVYIPNSIYTRQIERYCKRANFYLKLLSDYQLEKQGVYIFSKVTSFKKLEINALAILMIEIIDEFEDMYQYFSQHRIDMLLLKTDLTYVKMNTEKNGVANTVVSRPVVGNEHICNQEIYKRLLKTLDIAEEEIDIVAPWISTSVVNDKFIGKLEETLDRGVKVKILYGIGHGDDGRMIVTEKIANSLGIRFRKYGANFRMSRGNTHYKLLLCDEKYLIAGSYNFLSFRGNYERYEERHEGADYRTDRDEIRYKRKKYFNF